MTNEEIYYQQFKNAQYPMTIYLAQCTTFIVDLMDLAREEGFGEGLKNARKADELRASFKKDSDYLYYIFKRELDEEL